MSDDSARAVERLGAAADLIRVAAGELLWTRRDADHTDLYGAGAALTAITGALEEITGHLADGARHYADDRAVYDDENANPTARLNTAATYLNRANGGYATAYRAVSAYHAAIGHIGVDSV